MKIIWHWNVMNGDHSSTMPSAALYPPGSTFKMVPATAALSEGVINPNTTVVDSGPIYLPNRFSPDDLITGSGVCQLES